jgi:hypothetical protein
MRSGDRRQDRPTNPLNAPGISTTSGSLPAAMLCAFFSYHVTAISAAAKRANTQIQKIRRS